VLRSLRPSIALPVLALALLLPATAHAASVEVDGTRLKLTLSLLPQLSAAHTAAAVHALPDGGAILGFYGYGDTPTVGAGCQAVPSSNFSDPDVQGIGGPFAVTCDLTGVRLIEGTLADFQHSQIWVSRLNLPTRVTARPDAPGDTIITGDGGDIINGSSGPDLIDPGGAPYAGQEALPNTGDKPLDDPHVNDVFAGAGDDTIRLDGRHLGGGTGRDVINGGDGEDTVSYEKRFGIGAPNQVGVNVTLDGVANDGDPAVDPPDSTTPGEGDNVRSDVENVTGTKREDSITGTAEQNVLTGLEGKDTLIGGAGVDTLMAREPSSPGIKDTVHCGAPPEILGFGGVSFVTGNKPVPRDSLDADLADVPPADCEQVTQGPVNEGPNVVIGAAAKRVGTNAVRIGLTCPRDAGRTCAGAVGVSGRTGGRGPTSAFSLKRGKRGTVTVALPAAAAKAIAGRQATLRFVSRERGRLGAVNTFALAGVPAS
jgi:Ca2+-binding RTX toxin-like protein